MPIIVSAGGASVPTYALLDSGAGCCAISETLALMIGAPVNTIVMKLGTFDSQSVAERPIADFDVTDLNESFTLRVEKALIGNVYSSQFELPPTQTLVHKYPHLAGVLFTLLPATTVHVILGARYASNYFTGEVIMGKDDEPFAVTPKFGPTLVGPTQEAVTSYDADVCALDFDHEDDNDCLSDQIRLLFRNEFLMREGEIFPPEKVHPLVSDLRSEKILQESITFDPVKNKYVVDLPWRLGREKTAEIFSDMDFYNMALNRQHKLKQKFLKNPELMSGSFAQIRETLSLGHSRVLDTLAVQPGVPVCYLPNLVVLHPDKPGKFRVCQDAAAQVKGKSLNSFLWAGPDLMNNLVGILTRCRRGRYVVTADIKNFFYQIMLNPKDAPALRYFWWSDEEMTTIIVIEGSVHLFGIASSPTVATFVFRHHFATLSDIPEWIKDVVRKSFYVDDLMHSFDTE